MEYEALMTLVQGPRLVTPDLPRAYSLWSSLTLQLGIGYRGLSLVSLKRRAALPILRTR